jgi:hypothetical protein
VFSGIEGSGSDLGDPSRTMALLVGIVFALMGLFVGLGAAMPGPGSRLLNVEDEEELRDLRTPLLRSAMVMVLAGAMVGTLGLANGNGWQGIISPTMAARAVGGCLLGIALLSYLGRDDNDELMRSIARQAAAWGMYAALTVFVVWGSLAHLGYVSWITPLDMVSALMVLQLLAITAVCARRGVLQPR